jgi:hypothetical protein
MPLTRLGPTCGLLFLPLYAGFTFVPDLPEASYSDAEVLALYADPLPFTVAAVCIALAGAAFLVFLADLLHRLGTGPLASLAGGAGTVYVGALFLAGVLWTGYAGGGAGPLEDAPLLDGSATLPRILTDMAFGALLVFGLVAAAVCIAAVSVAARREGLLPTGVALTGLVITPLLLAGVTWVPQFLVPLWVAAVSVTLLRTSRPAPQPATV